MGGATSIWSITHLYIGVVLDGQGEDLARVVVETADDVVEGEASVTHGGEQQWQHGLQTRVAGGWVLPALLLQGVRS